MYAVPPFIDQDRDRGIRSSIGNMFRHFFHDEWNSPVCSNTGVYLFNNSERALGFGQELVPAAR